VLAGPAAVPRTRPRSARGSRPTSRRRPWVAWPSTTSPPRPRAH